MLKKKISSVTFGLITLSFLLVSAFIYFAPTSYAAVDAQQEACNSIGGDYNSKTNECTTSKSVSITQVIKTVVSIISIAVGTAAVIMLMVGGFKYITSGGDSGKVSSAKNTIIYSIVGLLVAFSAQILTQFVFDQVTNLPSIGNSVKKE